MLAKGNRSKAVTDACKRARRLLPRLDRRPRRAPGQGLHHQGRGARVPRARHGGGLEDRGRDFPAFIVVDDKGNDFFADFTPPGGAGREALKAARHASLEDAVVVQEGPERRA